MKGNFQRGTRVSSGAQFLAQLRRSEVAAEKVRSAVIMQAWLDGSGVVEVLDEIIIEERKP